MCAAKNAIKHPPKGRRLSFATEAINERKSVSVPPSLKVVKAVEKNSDGKTNSDVSYHKNDPATR